MDDNIDDTARHSHCLSLLACMGYSALAGFMEVRDYSIGTSVFLIAFSLDWP